MTVTINKTDGTVLTTIADGTVDTSSTNIALIGRLYKNYGELVNENMVKLLENFASSISPSSPIIGQLWYDKAAESIKVYRDSGFVPLARITSSSAEPNSPNTADLWYDLTDEQLKYYSGTQWIVISPGYTASQTRTGSFAENIQDTSTANHVAVVIRQQTSPIAIFSKDPEYTPLVAISGFPTIKPGLNMNNAYGFNGTTSNAGTLDGLDSTQFLRSDTDDTTTGTLGILNDGGLTIGDSGDLVIDLSSTTARIRKVTTGSLQFIMGGDLAAQINTDEQFLLQDGTPTVPKLSWINDTDTGFYKPSNGNLAVSVNGLMRSYWNTEGMHVQGTLHATNTLTVTGNANFDSSINVVSNLTVNGPYVTLGNTTDDNVIIYGSNIDVPNDVRFKTGDVSFQGFVTLESGAESMDDFDVVGDFSVDGISTFTGNANISGRLRVDGNVVVTENATISGNATVGGTFTVTTTDSNDFEIDSLGVVTINRTNPRVGYTNEGDLSMGSNTIDGFARDNAIFARNVPRHVVTFNGVFESEAIYRSHHVATVTRSTTGTYTIFLATDDLPLPVPIPLTSGQPTIIGSAVTADGDTAFVSYNASITGGDTSVTIYCYDDGGNLQDCSRVSVAIWDGAN